jgi:hypothetical protein
VWVAGLVRSVVVGAVALMVRVLRDFMVDFLDMR